jgi:cytochrome c oxidase subunit 2
MIPGRVNRLPLEPTRTGTYRGACAEFCGTSHARMNFIVEVMERDAFDRWLDEQAQPASAPADATAQRGHAAFLEHGCSTCHTVRGAGAFGVEGPDLTHVGSRRTIAAGQLPAEPQQFRRWISSSEILKPGAHMPAFAELPDDTLAALAAYLTQLQ